MFVEKKNLLARVVFRIRDLGSVHWITNPDPALFVEVPKKNKFFTIFLRITYCRYIYNSLQRQQVMK